VAAISLPLEGRGIPSLHARLTGNPHKKKKRPQPEYCTLSRIHPKNAADPSFSFHVSTQLHAPVNLFPEPTFFSCARKLFWPLRNLLSLSLFNAHLAAALKANLRVAQPYITALYRFNSTLSFFFPLVEHSPRGRSSRAKADKRKAAEQRAKKKGARSSGSGQSPS